jgi:hypothetical protein
MVLVAGCCPHGKLDEAVRVETVKPAPKFKFQDRIEFDYGYYGTCESTIKNAPWWAAYCGKSKTPEYIYFFSDITCGGERMGREFPLEVCETNIKLKPKRRKAK